MRPHLLLITALAAAAAPASAAPATAAPATAAPASAAPATAAPATAAPATAVPGTTSTPAFVLEDYIVQEGDTCLTIARDRFGDPKRVDVVHRHNRLGAVPHHLKPGQILRLPPPTGSGGPEAEVTSVRNSVDTFTPDRKKAKLNEKLGRGHKVGTDDKSAAEVTFADKSRLELAENTLVVILGHARAVAQPGALPETALLTGALRARLGAREGGTPGPAVARIRTDAGEVELHDCEFKVSVDTA